tara:strand:- start:275 stop:397 length:123 start_codon:yes stop_codon:yes gene_type:complete
MGKKISKEIKKEKIKEEKIKVEIKQEPIDHLAQQWAEHNS